MKFSKNWETDWSELRVWQLNIKKLLEKSPKLTLAPSQQCGEKEYCVGDVYFGRSSGCTYQLDFSCLLMKFHNLHYASVYITSSSTPVSVHPGIGHLHQSMHHWTFDRQSWYLMIYWVLMKMLLQTLALLLSSLPWKKIWKVPYLGSFLN